MKACFTKLCKSPIKVFCEEHHIFLCYGCNDRYHDQCRVSFIVDSQRITENIATQRNVLKKMEEDQKRLQLDKHINGIEEFILKYQKKINDIQTSLQNSIKQDQCLEYERLLQSILKLNRAFKADIIYQQYSDFIIKFKATNKDYIECIDEPPNETQKSDYSSISQEDSEMSDDLLEEWDQNRDLQQIYERVMECEAHIDKLQKLKIDLSDVCDIQLIEKINEKNIQIENLESISICNCEENKLILSYFLLSSKQKNINTLKLSCGSNCAWEDCEIRSILGSLISSMISMKPKEVYLDGWRINSSELSKLLRACSECESIFITKANLEIVDEIDLGKDINFKCKELEFSSYMTGEFNTLMSHILKGISKSSLKTSLREIRLGKDSTPDLSSLESTVKSLGLSHISFLEVSKLF
ncbi:unnamed protein product [Moneuplotes crassus]|uniref:Uncharacterized protein n=1 Tax=Euplotes crassus TaxID=5936 RepID=A0AAD1X8Y2_EUPCR|nr:unnamed protein product [Moneuplotes crassus]